MNIQLSIEEALDYRKFESELAGYQAGVVDTLNYVRRIKVEAILKARKPEPEEK